MSQLKVPQGETPVWPMVLNYSRHKCFQILRRLELEAYSKVVSVFRAQGSLTGEKLKVLYKLQRLLSISTDRHKAEIRRAVNDEELITISQAASGKEVYEEWIVEGKRIAPILHRPSPQTIYLTEANRAAFNQLCENYSLPPPCETAYLNLTSEPMQSEHKPITSFAEDKAAVKSYSTQGTQTVKFSTDSPNQVGDSESHEADNPRVDSEMTCETDSVSVPTELLNGHVKHKAPFVVDSHPLVVRGSHGSLEGQTDPGSVRQLPSECESPRPLLSSQLNFVHGMPSGEPQPDMQKHAEATQRATNKASITQVASAGSGTLRKRCLSTSPNTTEALSAPSKLLSLVHAPNTLTTARRPVQSQLMQNSTQPDAVLGSCPSEQTLPRVSEAMPSNYTSVQRVQTKTPHGMQGLSTSSTTRPHSQLVLQMCRPMSDSPSVSDPTLSISRSGNSAVAQPLTGQSNAGARTYPGMQISGSNISFKPSLIGSRIQRPGTTSLNDVCADYTQRNFSANLTPSIAVVHSLQGVAGPHRVPTAMNTVVLSHSPCSLSTDAPRQTVPGTQGSVQTLAPSSFKANPVPVVNISNNHIPTLSKTQATNTTSDSCTSQSSLTTRRLVSSAQPLVVPGLQVASNVVQATITPSPNSNVIVFQRAMGGRKPSNLCPTPIKLTTTTGTVPSTSTPISSVVTGSSATRQIRIVGFSSNAFSTSGATSAITTAPSTVPVTQITRLTSDGPTLSTTNTDLVLNNPADFEKSQSDTVSNLLSRASRLGAMLEVDLDAEDYAVDSAPANTTASHSDNAQHADFLTNTSLLAGSMSQLVPSSTASEHQEQELLQSVVKEPDISTYSNRVTTIRTSSSSQPTDPLTFGNLVSDNPVEEKESFDAPAEVPTNKKIDQLKAILGLTTHGAIGTEAREEFTAEQSKNFILGSRPHSCNLDQMSSTSEGWMSDRTSFPEPLAPDAKRARLSPSVSDSPPGGRRVPLALQHALEPSSLGVETRPDPVLP